MSSNIVEKIKKLKEETDTLILAHTYMDPEIVDLADISGDSFALSRAAQKPSNKRVLMCGVRFMAETVKILSPEKQVILVSPDSGCPMAECLEVKRVAEFKRNNPDVCICAYINTTAALKAHCDVCVTSSTAVKIVKALPQKDILFIPDSNLGTYVKEQVPEKNIILWEGCCPVHGQLVPEDIINAKKEHPDALVAMHPECPPEVCALADFLGATSSILDYCKASEKDVIIATEKGVCDWLSLHCPEKKFYQAAPEKLICQDMKKTTLETVYNALLGTAGEEILMDEELRLNAKKPIDLMLSYGG